MKCSATCIAVHFISRALTAILSSPESMVSWVRWPTSVMLMIWVTFHPLNSKYRRSVSANTNVRWFPTCWSP